MTVFLLRMVERRCFIDIAFQLSFRNCNYKSSRRPNGTATDWHPSAPGL